MLNKPNYQLRMISREGDQYFLSYHCTYLKPAIRNGVTLENKKFRIPVPSGVAYRILAFGMGVQRKDLTGQGRFWRYLVPVTDVTKRRKDDRKI